MPQSSAATVKLGHYPPWSKSCDKFEYKSDVLSRSKAQKDERRRLRPMAGSNDSDSIRTGGDVHCMGSNEARLLVGPILQSTRRWYCDWAHFEFCFYRSDIRNSWSDPVAEGTGKP